MNQCPLKTTRLKTYWQTVLAEAEFRPNICVIWTSDLRLQRFITRQSYNLFSVLKSRFGNQLITKSPLCRWTNAKILQHRSAYLCSNKQGIALLILKIKRTIESDFAIVVAYCKSVSLRNERKRNYFQMVRDGCPVKVSSLFSVDIRSTSPHDKLSHESVEHDPGVFRVWLGLKHTRLSATAHWSIWIWLICATFLLSLFLTT